jgi:hypothetical protein
MAMWRQALSSSGTGTRSAEVLLPCTQVLLHHYHILAPQVLGLLVGADVLLLPVGVSFVDAVASSDPYSTAILLYLQEEAHLNSSC